MLGGARRGAAVMTGAGMYVDPERMRNSHDTQGSMTVSPRATSWSAASITPNVIT